MHDIAYSNVPLAVARKQPSVGQPGALGKVGKYSTVLRCLAYTSGFDELAERGSFEVLQNHQDFVWITQEYCRAVPCLAVQICLCHPEPVPKQHWPWQQSHSGKQQPLHAAVVDMGKGRGLVPGSVSLEGNCRVGWGNRAHTPTRFWVMCWPNVLPIVQDGFMLRKIIARAAAADEKGHVRPDATSPSQQKQQATSQRQPSIISLDENVLHIVMGHLVGQPWAQIIQRVWDEGATTRAEVDGVCMRAGIPAELCKVWWPASDRLQPSSAI